MCWCKGRLFSLQFVTACDERRLKAMNQVSVNCSLLLGVWSQAPTSKTPRTKRFSRHFTMQMQHFLHMGPKRYLTGFTASSHDFQAQGLVQLLVWRSKATSERLFHRNAGYVSERGGGWDRGRIKKNKPSVRRTRALFPPLSQRLAESPRRWLSHTEGQYWHSA